MKKLEDKLFPANGLLMIDAQKGLLDGEEAIPNAAVLVDRLAIVLAGARSAGALVVHLQHDGAPGTVDEPGKPGWFIHPTLAPKPGEVVLRKTDDDGFEGTGLDAMLASKQVTRIAVAGLLSEMCVSATVRGALRRGIEVVLVSDAHGTFDLDDIASTVVSRVAEHALGDEVGLIEAGFVMFERPLT